MQRVTVATADIITTIGDQATDLVLTRIVFPISLPASKPEQDLGELAITHTRRPTIKRAQYQDMPAPCLLREIMCPPALGPTDQCARHKRITASTRSSSSLSSGRITT